MSKKSDTIYAKSSGAGVAGVSVFRVSGNLVDRIATSLTGKTLKSRLATYVSVQDTDDALIDEGLVILFKGPKSFTGEDVLELQLHGSRAVENALYESLSALGARPAQAGEFTLRAFQNGKLDLAQSEALSDLLAAETTQQRKQALGQLGGNLSALSEGWRAQILGLMAHLEAEIDFPDEGGVPEEVAARALPQIVSLKQELQKFLTSAARAQVIREGVSMAIIGPPNAGKSSLINRLAGSDVAIVSDQPGTTRDVIEARLDLGGVPVTLSDTAGIRTQSADEIEKKGIEKAYNKAKDATFRLLVVDGSTVSRETFMGKDSTDVSRETLDLLEPGDFLIWNKSDLKASEKGGILTGGITALNVSAKTGAGITELIDALAGALNRDAPQEGPALTRARHVHAVEEAIAALTRAEASLSAGPELAAEDARLAVRALGTITGKVGVEDILGEIFSSFCIGK